MKTRYLHKVSKATEELLRLELLEERMRVGELQDELRRLKESSSWRVTSPLRQLAIWLRRNNEVSRGMAPAMPPPFLPLSLARRDMPCSGAEESCRVVDARPFLAGVIPPATLAALSSPLDIQSLSFEQSPAGRVVALVGSAELAVELAFNTSVRRLIPGSWTDQIAGADFLLIDCGWRHVSSDWGDGLQREGVQRDELFAVIRHCRSIGIPVVTWLRMEKHDYACVKEWVGNSDQLYAIDSDLLETVAADNPSARLGLLAPAIQPGMHNPICTPGLRNAVAAQLGNRFLLDAQTEVLDRSIGSEPLRSLSVAIVDTYWDVNFSRVEHETEFHGRFLGNLRVEDKLVLSKLMIGECFLAGGHRPAWWKQQQAMRTIANGGLVGVWGNGRWVVAGGDDGGGSPWLLEPSRQPLESLSNDALARSAWSRRFQRMLLREHTYENRLVRIEEDLGIACRSPRKPRVSCILVTKRPELLEANLETFRSQTWADRELVVVVHTDSIVSHPLVDQNERICYLTAASTMSLGDCMNMAIDAATGDYCLKFDDDDFYGPHYVEDMVAYVNYMQVDLLGKPLSLTVVGGGAEVMMDDRRTLQANTLYEAGWPAGVVCGATIGGRKSVMSARRFDPRKRYGVDSKFLNDCASDGRRLLVMDILSFACIRNDRPGFHTWIGWGDEIRARGRSIGEWGAVRNLVS